MWKTILTVKNFQFFFPKSAVLKENKKIVENQNEVANIFNDFFSKVVPLFQIPESNNIDSSVMKYRRHPSITAIQDAYKRSSFSFSTVEKVDVIRKSKTSFMMMIFLLKYWKAMLASSQNTLAFFAIMQ